MVAKLMNQVLQAMSQTLGSQQLERLKDVLEMTFKDVELIEKCESKVDTNILNQWTFHQRLYSAAHYVCSQKDMEMVQLVSFGCGIDAITTDEVRSILENKGKIYTQIKIDEINNLSAVNIRLRSLLGALEMREGK